MSQRLISRSADLCRLQQEGYEVQVSASGHLVLGHVPYVTETREVRCGRLFSGLEMAGDVTVAPTDHVAYFDGVTPCDHDGRPLERIIHSYSPQVFGPDLEAQLSFSSKPSQGYADYFEKMTTYIRLLAGPAQALDPGATAQTFPVVESGDEPSVFRYLDTASGRAGISELTARLQGVRLAIVGLGGTGSYLLDLVAKTPVHEIHLFDGDDFLQHNAFRAPGAASVEQLRERRKKTDHMVRVYDAMRIGVVSHPYRVDETNVTELDGMDFVFLAVDDGPAKRVLVQRLEAAERPFIDVGMGVWHGEGGLGGTLRVTTSTPDYRDSRRRMSFGAADEPDQYDTNIQIADLNALNATLAVIRWKKLCGFYADLEREHCSMYEIDGNNIINEDAA